MSDVHRFLVTGGAGFIGSHLVTALLVRGHEVVVLDDLSTGRRENLEAAVAAALEATSAPNAPDRLQFVEASILDAGSLAEAVDGVAGVLHQAAIPSVPRSFADPAGTMRANVEGTTLLLEACRRAGVRRIAMASSSSIYGDTPVLPKEESMEPTPMSPYALSKLSAEQVGGIFARSYGQQVYALRYFNVFGPRQDPTSEYSAVIPKFITRMMAGEAPVIFGDGGQSRDFTYIDDVVAANLMALDAGRESAGEAPGGGSGTRRGAAEGSATESDGGCFHVVNIGGGRRYTLIELVAALNEILGTDLTPEHADPRPGDVRHSHAAIDRARDVLGYAPAVSFEEGLLRTVESFRGD